MMPLSRATISRLPFICPSLSPTNPRPHTTIPSTSNINPVDDPPEPLEFRFMEEPLGIPASEGFGYYQARLGGVLGPGGRYKLEAKLGFGMASSVWLARDLRCVMLQGFTSTFSHKIFFFIQMSASINT